MGEVVGEDTTFVITCWVAEHEDEVGIIFLNDCALGELFGGRKGFEAKLAEQGFVNVRNLATPEECEAAKQPPPGKKFGDWGGPWRTYYPWETCDAVQFESGDLEQQALERALLKEINRTAPFKRSSDESAPTFCETEMDADTERWLDKQAHEAALAGLVGLVGVVLDQTSEGENYD